MAWSKILARSSMARIWELLSLARGAAGLGCKRASARARAATMVTLAEDVLGIRQATGKHCTVLAMRLTRVVGMYTR